MAARVVAYGTEERLPKGTLVFERGERSVDFFFVLEGEIEIFDFDERWRAQRLHGARRTAIHRRARPVQRSTDPGLRSHRRRQPGGPGQAPRLSSPGDRRAGHRRDHHAGVHPAPRRPHPARAGWRRADRARAPRRHAAPPALPDPQRLPAPAARHRGRSGRRRVPRLLRAHARPAPGRDLAGPSGAAQSVDRGARRRPGADRDDRSRARLRRRRRRRRPGGTRGRRLRRIGRAGHDRHRGHGARRPGRHLVQDRELSRLPDRHLRPGARRSRAGAGAEVRSAACDLAQCCRHRLRQSTLPDQARRRSDDLCPCNRRRHRRPLPKAGCAELREVRRSGHPLRRHRHGGAALRRRRGDRCRRRQLGRPGRGVPVANGRPRPRPGARKRPRRHHVRLSRPAHPAVARRSRSTPRPRSRRSRATTACAR